MGGPFGADAVGENCGQHCIENARGETKEEMGTGNKNEPQRKNYCAMEGQSKE